MTSTVLAAICLVKSHSTVFVTTTLGLLPLVAAGASLAAGLDVVGFWVLGVVHPVSSPKVSSDDTSQLGYRWGDVDEWRGLIFIEVMLWG